MLQLITGRSGSGKTERIFESIREVLSARPEANVYLLVPEQASFGNEKAVLARFGDTLSQRVTVISFTRLANMVFRHIGGVAGKRMDTTASLLLMDQAIAEVTDRLQVYGRQGKPQRYLQQLSSMITECKQNGITPALLAETASHVSGSVLGAKAADISLIFSAYEALLEQSQFLDPLDELTVLAQRLPDCDLFDGSEWFVDGFTGFTGQEFRVLTTLLTRVRSMTVALCCDGIAAHSTPATDRFYTANRTARRLRDWATEHRVAVAKTCHLTHNYRTDSDALQLLEGVCYTTDAAVCEEPTETVQVIACADRAEECRFAAHTIRRLLRENGGYCRDFTVVVRDLEAYAGLLETALQREELSYYMDRRESMVSQPLTALIETALTVVLHGWQTTDVLRLCKTGLLGFSPLSLGQLEDYAFVWAVRGAMWQQPFTEHPEGFGKTVDATAQRKLVYLNGLRRRIAEPLMRFSAAVSGNRSGQEFASALFALLQEWRVPRMVRFQAARLSAQKQVSAAEHHAGVWDHVMEILDTFALEFHQKKLPLLRFSELFHLAVLSSDFGTIPQTLDGVCIGAADRIRYADCKTVFVLGANEGVFPAYPIGNSMFTERERQRLAELGLQISNGVEERAAEERYFAYAAIAAPSERLYVTYADRVGNEAAKPSALVAEIARTLPHHRCSVAAEDMGTESAADAFMRMTETWDSASPLAVTLRQVFEQDPAYRWQMAALCRPAERRDIENHEVARALFGNHLRLSPTQIKTYYHCRFAYFCKYGIRLKTRQAAEVNAAQAGSLTHYVMQTVLPKYVDEGFAHCSRERIEKDTAQAVAAYAQTQFGGMENNDARTMYLLTELTRFSSMLLWRVVEELKQAVFVPVDYELSVGRADSPIEPWILTTPDGGTIHLQGTVDRVDRMQKDGYSYLRIVDYKTGRDHFNLSDVLEGLDLQMLIYLFSICRGGTKRYGDARPAGVLYLPVQLPTVEMERGVSFEQSRTNRLKSMKANGLLLDDTDVLQGMEANLQGVFIPAKYKSSGDLDGRYSTVLSLKQFERLQQRVGALLLEMAQHLHHGQIDPCPTVHKDDEDGCVYCDYKDICGREKGDAVRKLSNRSFDEALRDLDGDSEEVSDNG